MRRGEIYYIARHDTVGAEIAKSRPGIIVSNDSLNATNTVVEVVFLTTQPKRMDGFTHVAIAATGRPSTALCEQISTVAVQLVENLCGVCSAEEMAEIDKALLYSLGLTAQQEARTDTHREATELRIRLAQAHAERDAYKTILNRFLPEEG